MTEAAAAERLDKYVAGKLSGHSRSFAARLIEQGKVTVNGQVQPKASYRLHSEDKVKIDRSGIEEMPKSTLKLPVIYEDKDCVVINKPAGVLTHSKGAFNPEPTVATWLAPRLKPGMDGERAGIVHRLDRATSGVMICAKTPEAQSWLQKQFSARKVKKTYAAVVKGSFDQATAIIDMPIERNPRRPQTFRVGSRGKPAVTKYRVIKTDGSLSLVELSPETGRTHQLRVHMSHLGHPIAGDTFYGGQQADRMFLHAEELELTLPSRERKIFRAALPPEFEEYLGQ